MPRDFLNRKNTSFVLWLPNLQPKQPPRLIIRHYTNRETKEYDWSDQIALVQVQGKNDLWEKRASQCGLVKGNTYHYWFEVEDNNPYKIYSPRPLIWCTDPTAWTIDREILADPLWPESYGRNSEQPVDPFEIDPNDRGLLQNWRIRRYYMKDDLDPASVVKYDGANLVVVDPDNSEPVWPDAAVPIENHLSPNRQLVIYELPSRWARLEDGVPNRVALDGGTFQNITNCLLPDYLPDLHITALELLPPADSIQDRLWGYGTTNFLAPDYELGTPTRETSQPNTALASLVQTCHEKGIRFFADVSMLFSRNDPYQKLDFLPFHVQLKTGDPEEAYRPSYGGEVFKYNYVLSTYNPDSGVVEEIYPARSYMLMSLTRWMLDFRLDGLRLDAVHDIVSDKPEIWQFIKDYRDTAYKLWWGANAADPAQYFHVTSELFGKSYLTGRTIVEKLNQQYLDSAWTGSFKELLRKNLLINQFNNDWEFKNYITEAIYYPFKSIDGATYNNGTQVVNYLTSHDEPRLFEYLKVYLKNSSPDQAFIDAQIAPRIKLGYACLMTAVGIPLLLAGEEFADEQDLKWDDTYGDYNKQVDPVNYSRKDDPWRKQILEYVARLIAQRTTYPALAEDETAFLHWDYTNRVAAWSRGKAGSQEQVFVVANFSENTIPGFYHLQNWPGCPAGVQWYELTYDNDWKAIGPNLPDPVSLGAWEAKVYQLRPL